MGITEDMCLLLNEEQLQAEEEIEVEQEGLEGSLRNDVVSE